MAGPVQTKGGDYNRGQESFSVPPRTEKIRKNKALVRKKARGGRINRRKGPKPGHGKEKYEVGNCPPLT